MNNLQGLITNSPLLVSLNPKVQPRDDLTHMQISYEHPVFSQNAVEAQKSAWQMQGVNRTWFCGSYFGYGFHEDGLQSGLAVAEQLSDCRRPWDIPNPSSRIFIPTSPIGGQA
jgi:predicted NAD/FAD-binding protein